MEADQTTEGPQDTQDAKEQPSLKDPNAEDLYEATTHETPLQPSGSQKHFQPPEIHLETPAPLNADTKGSEGLQDSSVSGTPPVKSSSSGLLSLPPQLSPQSVTSLEKAIAEIPLEELDYGSPVSKVKEEPLELSPTANIPEYESPISEVQKEPLEVSPTASIPESSHELTSDKVPQTQAPESEHFPKHSFSESPTQAKEDGSTKEGEAGEDELAVGTSKIPAAKPGLRAKKKKEKRAGAPPFPGVTSRPVVPAKRAELVEMAKAVHREQFDDQVKNLFQWEKDSTLKAIQTGIYIGWRCPHYLWDCFRIGDESKCFCGHLLREHQIISDLSVPCSVSQCRCLMFCFIPSRPEEVGEFWLKKRATFDPKAWRAQCRCKHTHEEHAATGAHPCRHRGCFCPSFESNFLCVACDRRWEEHETFFETGDTRRKGKRPYGANNIKNWHRNY
ncbi:protein FAM221B isoform X3 [Mus caroli]|uniref:Protein FAM221B isoform X3 n=1 Tax=Mus caroli TaxID=10089 RepID=A0A6P5PJI2_MUSCR|nr:protein FAM221B isoform X3 [Mus caroli]